MTQTNKKAKGKRMTEGLADETAGRARGKSRTRGLRSRREQSTARRSGKSRTRGLRRETVRGALLRTCIVLMLTTLAAGLLLGRSSPVQASEGIERRDVRAMPVAATAPGRELAVPVDSDAGNFWTQDVWADPDRPFLFYGVPEKDEGVTTSRGRARDKEQPEERNRVAAKPAPGEDAGELPSLAIFPADGVDKAVAGERLTRQAEQKGLAVLKAITTVKGLKDEVQGRLDRAVMNPTPQAIALYLQANAFLMQKAGVFAESWRRSLVNNPRFDWTAVRPAVNVVSASLSAEREGRMLHEVGQLAGDYGLVFFGDASVMTRHMLRQVRDFVAQNGFEAAYVSKNGGEALMPGSRPDKGLSRLLAGGIEQFPSLVLVRRGEKDPRKARLIATGAADAVTLARNTWAAALEMAQESAAGSGEGRVGVEGEVPDDSSVRSAELSAAVGTGLGLLAPQAALPWRTTGFEARAVP